MNALPFRFGFPRAAGAALAACFIAAVALRAVEKPPEWLGPVPTSTQWRESAGAEGLLYHERVSFTAPDRMRKLTRRAFLIHNDSGRAAASVDFAYDPNNDTIRGAQAWLIRPNPEKSVRFERADFSDSVNAEGGASWDPTRTLSLDCRETALVGDVWVWEIDCEYQLGVFDWKTNLLSALPQRDVRIEVVPARGARLLWHSSSKAIPAPVADPASGGLRWTVPELAPLAPDLPGAVLANPLTLSVRCVPGNASAGTWSDLSRLAAELIEPRTTVTPEIKAKAEALVVGRIGRWERIRALTEFVQRDVYYLSLVLGKDTLAGCRPRPAADCLRERFGDCKDKATLLASLLRAVGEDGHVVLVYSGNPRVIAPEWPSLCFNHAIAAIPVGADTPAQWPQTEVPGLGRVVFFDPTDPYTPLGVLPDRDQSGYGLVVLRNGAEIVRLPGEDPAVSAIERRITAQVDADGVLDATVDESYGGSLAASLYTRRCNSRLERTGRDLLARVHQRLPLATGLTWTNSWKTDPACYALNFHFRAPRFLEPIGPRQFLLQPHLFGQTALLEPWEMAQDGVGWMATYCLREEIRFRLPAGLEVDALPADWADSNPTASGRLSYRSEGGEVIILREVKRQAEFVDRAGYENLRGQLDRIHQAERRPVLLRRI